jgi:flagellar hook-basal body complex protein FliE
LAEEAEKIDVAEVEIVGEGISVTFASDVEPLDVYNAADTLFGVFKDELDAASMTITLANEKTETFDLDQEGVVGQVAFFLLDGMSPDDFLAQGGAIEATYTAAATDNEGVGFTLAGTLTFAVQVDTSAYDAIVAQVATLDEDAYTKSSWAAYEVAIEDCNLELTAADGQAALDAEVVKIEAALALLEEKDPVVAKAAFLAALAEEAEKIDVAEVEIVGEGISVTFASDVEPLDVYNAADTLFGVFKDELDAASMTITLANEKTETFDLDQEGVVGQVAFFLLDGMSPDDFLAQGGAIEATYTAAATDNEGVGFTLAGTLTFAVQVDTSAYDAIVAQVATLDEDAYTKSSWAAYEVAIEDCNLELTAADGQAALDAEVVKIEAALALLEEKDPA